jgi:hypothetical protein
MPTKKRKQRARTLTMENWSVVCDSKTFARCKADKRFPYIVMLSRAVNSLNFVHSAMIRVGQRDEPEMQRDRLSSYFFASATLYECFNLIKSMEPLFLNDAAFRKTLQPFLKQKRTKTLREEHLNHVRNGAVFHFQPERTRVRSFVGMINSAAIKERTFASGLGKRKGGMYYTYADILTSEVLVGLSVDSNENRFYAKLEKIMVRTRDLAFRFAHQGEILIGHHLIAWGFRLE